jgi:hypothetical protein
MMVVARVNIDDFANRVLNVVKAQFGLKDKSEALNKFFRMFGNEFVEEEVKEEYIKKLLIIENEEHFSQEEFERELA